MTDRPEPRPPDKKWTPEEIAAYEQGWHSGLDQNAYALQYAGEEMLRLRRLARYLLEALKEQGQDVGYMAEDPEFDAELAAQVQADGR